jgi:hypothetical protein
MGWTGTYTREDAVTVVRREIESGGYNRVLANRGAKWWLVESAKTGERFAVVALVKRRGNELLTKLMGEEEGPHECGYPLEWLPKLSPTDNEYAVGWRERVREYHTSKQSQPKLNPGDRVVFEEPIEFTDGSKCTELIFRGKYKFFTPRMSPVRMSRDWRTRYKWTVIPAEGAPV